jgi:hypothetical protein
MLLRIESLAGCDRDKPAVISMKNCIKCVISGGLA